MILPSQRFLLSGLRPDGLFSSLTLRIFMPKNAMLQKRSASIITLNPRKIKGILHFSYNCFSCVPIASLYVIQNIYEPILLTNAVLLEHDLQFLFGSFGNMPDIVRRGIHNFCNFIRSHFMIILHEQDILIRLFHLFD